MKINRNNYEAWLLDLFEGNLSHEEKVAVRLFLDENPDLKAELEDFEIMTLPLEDESLSAKAKGKLKRPYINPVGRINSSNYDDFFIGWHEGTLREDEKAEVTLFLEKNPDFQSEFELFGAIKLQPDESIVFPDKESLKKRSVIPLYSRIGVVSSVAAACIIMLLIFKPFTTSTVDNDTISMLQTKPFVLSSVTTELEMRPTATTLMHFEDSDGAMTDVAMIVTPEPELTIPPYAEQEISHTPKLRLVEVPAKTNRELIPPTNEYIMLMDYIRMREEMAAAEEAQPKEQKSGSLLGKVIQGLSRDLGESQDKFSVLGVLEFGVTQYHKLTNSPVTVEKEVNAEGQTNAYSVSTENFGVSHRKAEDQM